MKVYLRIKFTGIDEKTRYAGRWLEVPLVPRIGDFVVYGENYQADAVLVSGVEIWCGEAYAEIVIDGHKENCEVMADCEEEGTHALQKMARGCGFRGLGVEEWGEFQVKVSSSEQNRP